METRICEANPNSLPVVRPGAWQQLPPLLLNYRQSNTNAIGPICIITEPLVNKIINFPYFVEELGKEETRILITEETFEGGYHDGDYQKDGVMYCGYCHTPKQVLHQWRGELRAFPINCQCKRECLARIEAEREQREQREKAILARQHALPYPYMHQWTFASDDGGSPQATHYFKDYVAHFAEARADGSGLFLLGPRGSGKTYAAAQIVNALCDLGYRCLITSFLEIVRTLLSLNRENRQKYLDDICKHDLLVFDDFGGEGNSYFFDINLEDIVKTCYMKYIPMIVITPMAQDTLEQGLNPTRQKAVDRMKERCYCVTLRNTSRYKQLTQERKEKMENLLGISKKD